MAWKKNTKPQPKWQQPQQSTINTLINNELTNGWTVVIVAVISIAIICCTPFLLFVHLYNVNFVTFHWKIDYKVIFMRSKNATQSIHLTPGITTSTMHAVLFHLNEIISISYSRFVPFSKQVYDRIFTIHSKMFVNFNGNFHCAYARHTHTHIHTYSSSKNTYSLFGCCLGSFISRFPIKSRYTHSNWLKIVSDSGDVGFTYLWMRRTSKKFICRLLKWTVPYSNISHSFVCEWVNELNQNAFILGIA